MRLSSPELPFARLGWPALALRWRLRRLRLGLLRVEMAVGSQVGGRCLPAGPGAEAVSGLGRLGWGPLRGKGYCPARPAREETRVLTRS